MVLGVPHPRHLPLTAQDFMEWEAFARMEPWGFEVDSAHRAQLQATIANFSGNAKRVLRPSDFLPRKQQPVGDVADQVKRMFGFGR